LAASQEGLSSVSKYSVLLLTFTGTTNYINLFAKSLGKLLL
jgi:hypothetical protein